MKTTLLSKSPIDNNSSTPLGMIYLYYGDYNKAKIFFLNEIANYNNISKSLTKIAYRKSGAPFVKYKNKKIRNLNISLSHSNGYISFAWIKNHDIGLDIELIKDRKPMLSSAKKMLNAKNQNPYFIWTLKESLYKCVLEHQKKIDLSQLTFKKNHSVFK